MSAFSIHKLSPLGMLQACSLVRQLINPTAARMVSGRPPSFGRKGWARGREEGEEGGEEPHLLHAVWRIRSLKGRPYWEKHIMKQLQLDVTRKPVIHKNTPEVNMLLTKVRHLLRIKPVNPVFGLPDGEHDGTLLKWNGDFVVRRKIEPHSDEQTGALAGGAEGSRRREERSGDAS